VRGCGCGSLLSSFRCVPLRRPARAAVRRRCGDCVAVSVAKLAKTALLHPTYLRFFNDRLCALSLSTSSLHSYTQSLFHTTPSVIFCATDHHHGFDTAASRAPKQQYSSTKPTTLAPRSAKTAQEESRQGPISSPRPSFSPTSHALAAIIANTAARRAAREHTHTRKLPPPNPTTTKKKPPHKANLTLTPSSSGSPSSSHPSSSPSSSSTSPTASAAPNPHPRPPRS